MTKRILSLLLALAMILSYMPSMPVSAEGADITIEVPEDPIPYSEGQGAVTVLKEIRMEVEVENNTEKVLFAGGYFEVDIEDRRDTEILNLPDGTYEDKDENGEVVQTIKVEDGEIFIVHSEDNLEPIGRVNPSKKGDKGEPLVVEFSTPLENGDFTQYTGEILDGANTADIAGWTIRKTNGTGNKADQIWLGDLASRTQGKSVDITPKQANQSEYTVSGTDSRTNESYEFKTDVNYGGSSAGWKYEGVEREFTSSGSPGKYVASIGSDYNEELSYDIPNAEKDRGNVLKLGFNTNATVKEAAPSGDKNSDAYGSVFGPDAISVAFSAKEGDKIAFDWRAFIGMNGSEGKWKKDSSNYDDYEVYGFIIKDDSVGVSDIDSKEHILIMYGRGGVQKWTTNTFTIPEDGSYKFRFIAGSYDQTNGKKLGATLHIDNIRLFKKAVDSKLVEFIAKNITYENTDVNSLAHELIGDGEGEATRTVVITAGDLTDTENNTKIDTTVTATVNIELNKPPKVEIEDDDADRDEETGVITISKETDNMTTIEGSLSAEDPESSENELTYKFLTEEDTTDDTIITTENGGTVTIDENGNWSYTPKDDFIGEDQFTIRITDKDGGWTDVIIKVNVKDSPNIRFYKEEGDTEIHDTKKVGEGKSLDDDMPSDPTKEGFVFKYWYYKDNGENEIEFNEDTTITEDIEVYAKWNENPVIEDGEDGTKTSFDTDTKTPVTGTIVANDPDGEDGNLTYKLKDGNEGNTEITTEKGGKVTIGEDGNWSYTPNKDYVGDDTFTIIVTDKDGGKTEVEITITVKGTVTFDTNGGSPVPEDQIIEKDDKVAKPEDPTKTGHTFAGWYKDKDYNNQWKFDSNTVTENTTLYAKWTINKYKVTFDTDGGTETKPIDVDYNSSLDNYMPANPTKEGHIFKGWNTIKDGSGTNFTKNTKVTNNIEVFAQWDKIGESDTSTEVKSGDSKDGKIEPKEGKEGKIIYRIVDGPDNGEATVDEEGKWTYIPEDDFIGEDNFIIEIIYPNGDTELVPIKVVVKDLDAEETTKGTQKDGKVGTGESGDPGDKEYSYEIENGPEQGDATVDEDGEWTYTPGKDFDGEDEFTIVVKEDGNDEPIKEIPVKIVETDKGKPVEIDMPKTIDDDNPTYTIVKEPENGEIAIDGDGNWIYTPNENFTGEDEFVLEDEEGNEVIVKVIVKKPKERPTVTSEVYAPTTSTGITFEVGDKPEQGDATVDEDGEWTYTPGKDFDGEDEFTIVVKEDGNDEPIKEIPVKIVETDKGKPVEIDMPKTIDDDNPTYTIVKEPENGEVTIDGDGKATYRPNKDFTGIDEFVLEDEEGNEVVVVVIVQEPTTEPEEVTGKVTSPEDSDDGTKYKEEEDKETEKGGKVTIDEDGNWTYTPEPDFTGEDEFTVEIIDEDDDTIETVVVKIIVTDEDDPTLAIIDKDGEEGANGEVPLDEDRLGKIKYEISDGPTNGQAEIDDDGKWTYTPEDGFGGEDEFTIKVTYPNGDVELITIQVEVKIEVYIELTANPETIVANGKDKTELTATVKDSHGNPVEGVEVDFTTGGGKFEGSSSDNPKEYIAVTNENGIATVILISEKKVYDEGEEPEPVEIPVIARVDDKENGLTGSQEITMTFEPSSITGVVKDKDGKPIEGAKVRLGDREYFTDSNGRYRIFIPEGDKEYEVEIINEIKVGDETIEVAFTQKTEVGEVSGEKEETHAAKKTLTGVIITKDKDEQGNIVDKVAGKKDKNDSKESEKITIVQVSKDGKQLDSDEEAKTGEINPDTGVFTVEDLEVDTEYEFLIVKEIEVEKEDGTKETVELVMGKMEAKLTEDGEVTFHEELIDPYGTIRDNNGNVLGGVELRLYYANTQRNIDKGRKVNTLVPQDHLGGIFDFPPNDNANPQTSTSTPVYSDLTGDHGNYGWMVPNHGDYYIIGTKAGYKTYDSRMDANSGSGTAGNYYISVDDIIVKHDFTMDKSSSSGGTTIIPPKEEPKDEPTPEIIVDVTTNQRNYLEGTESTQEIDYLNEGDKVTGVELVVTIPEGAEVVDPDGGTVEGNTIVWLIEEIGPGERGAKNPTIKLPQISTGEETIVIEVQLMKDGKAIGEPSFIEVAVFSNRYGNGKHSRYILGYPDGDFKPDRQITRAEIATIFARILNLDNYVKNETMYKDVELDAWYARAVEAASRRGLFEGYEDGRFRPDDPISRAELAAVIARYLNLTEGKEIKEILKDIEGHWAEDHIRELYRNNVVSGYEDGTFKPQNKLKRSEAVTMINRMLNRGPLKGVEPTFPDVDLNHWANGEVEESTRSHEYYRNEDGSETLIKVFEENLNF